MIDDRQLARQRTRAGFRIGDGKRVDFFRYTAWMFERRHAPTADPIPAPGESAYARHSERARLRQADISRMDREIGEMPPVLHPRAKARAAKQLEFFARAYFPATFFRPWSKDHLRVIETMQSAVRSGGLFALGMPRGSGKSRLAECAALWAILFGYLNYVAIVGPDEAHAVRLLRNIKTQLESNLRLLVDFPEVCIPIRRLAGINQRRPLYRGQPIKMDFTEKQIIFPSLPANPAADAIIATVGITGQIRGLNFTRPSDMKSVRPGLVIIDDPQTDESARSVKQCSDREDTIKGTLLGLAGPGERLACIMPCTVIRPGDLADRFLDRNKNPEWRGIRTKMINRFPDNKELWEQYDDVRRKGFLLGDEGAAANAFYLHHQLALEAGGDVSWPARKHATDITALQHAMDIKFRNEKTFFAEYQNEPLPDEAEDSTLLTADEIAGRLSGYARRVIPQACTVLTAFIDVGKAYLFYAVTAWDPRFAGFVVDYGSFPDQRRPYFGKRDATNTLELAFKAAGHKGGFEACLTWGLKTLQEQLLGREWVRDDSAAMRIDRCLVDYGWGDYTNQVFEVCRQSPYAASLTPSHGRGVRAKDAPMAQWAVKPGDKIGLNWKMPVITKRGSCRYVTFDSNFWKTFLHERLSTMPGDPGCLQLFGRDRDAHRLFADQLTSEGRTLVAAKGRQIWEWDIKPDSPDNEGLDCLVGCAVGASIQGISIDKTTEPLQPRRRIIAKF